MDTHGRWFLGLVMLTGMAFASGVFAQTMPNVTPVSSVPIGTANGGGVVTRVTYEMRLAANDAGVATAANDARYVARAVTIGRGTIGTILLGVGRRAFWPLLAASAAYEAYKWYTDANGVLTQPGQSYPATGCLSSGYWQSNAWGTVTACTFPGVVRASFAMDVAHKSAGFTYTLKDQVMGYPSGQSYYTYTVIGPYPPYPDGRVQLSFLATANNTGIVDPAYSTNPAPVTNDQLGQLAEQHPDWWPQLLNDPQTGNPVITPEIASDMDALKHQIAPQYGVDPTTLPATQPDPNYLTGQAQPREQSLPQYCAWATEACNYYKFVEDNWPDTGKKQETDSADCVSPPSCSGDEVMCAVVRNTWANRCELKGTAPPPDGGTHVVGELDHGSQDLGTPDQLDHTGFGYGTSCPFTDITPQIGEHSFTIGFGPVCTYGPWLRWFLLALAGLKCAEIVGGVRSTT